MFPIGDDDHQGGGLPVVTWALIALNVLAFLLEINRPSEAALQTFIEQWGVVPNEYAAGRDLAPLIAAPFWSTLFTSMFLHGGWLHLGGNMLYLWIFGDNIERAMGAAKFLIFYLVCGLAASAAHILFNMQSGIPAVGASGAISGVLGGYLLMFPQNRIRVLTRGGIVHVPALVVLGFWIVLQVINGFGAMATTSESGGGIAFMAHIGGFVTGLVLVKLFATRRATA
ncbi:MAG TPA: rhomboid family intramembrane serine protease [Vicinamibacterales bacterium]|nr:rhomboid family intramembrane serine protease [Vicinamibacterales bacterium]